MSDHTDSKMRELTYRLVAMAPQAPPFPEDAMVQLDTSPAKAPPATRSRRLAWVAAAAVAAIVLIGAPVLLVTRGDDADSVPPATSVTVPEVVPATVPPEPATLLDLVPGTVVIADPGAATAADDGVVVFDAATAIGDGAGGLVVLRDGAVLRAGAGGTETVLLDVASLAAEYGPTTVRLEDVAPVDGSPRAVVVIGYGQEYPEIFEEVLLVDLDSGAVESAYKREAVESHMTRVSVAGGTMVVSWTFEGGTYFEYLDTSGLPVEVAAPYDGGVPGGIADGPIAITQAVLSPDGATLAYLELDTGAAFQPGAAVDLVLWDLGTGSERRRIEVPLEDEARMDYDGNRVVIGRYERLDDPPAFTRVSLTPLLVELSDGATITELGVAGTPSLIDP